LKAILADLWESYVRVDLGFNLKLLGLVIRSILRCRFFRRLHLSYCFVLLSPRGEWMAVARALQTKLRLGLTRLDPEAQPVVRPPLKWAGGKRWQLSTLQPFWETNCERRLVEPFCGGLAVALGLTPVRAVLNDINPHVINFYRWLKKGLTISFELKNEDRTYYQYRDRFNDLLSIGKGSTAESAGLFYYLNRTGYNGLCRFNSRGQFNVPFGRYAKIGYRTEFTEYKHAFAGWTFRNTDFEQLELSDQDFVYADPPYDVEFRQYSSGGFDWAEQERTAKWLAAHKGPVILSNQATPRIVTLYRSLGFRMKFLNAPRRISCTGDRTPAPEVLAVRNLE
jgi:DNA adenine methylase